MSRKDVLTIIAMVVFYGIGAGLNKARADQVWLEVGAYYNLSGLMYPADEYAWHDGGSPVAVFKLRYEGAFNVGKHKQHYTCEAMHISNWTTGAPFNDEHESVLDVVGCSLATRIGG